MQRLTRIIPPIQRSTPTPRSCRIGSALIPHAGPSTYHSLRLLSTTSTRSDAPFSALKRPQRYDRLQSSPLHPQGMPSSSTLRNSTAGEDDLVERYEVEVDRAAGPSRSAAEREADEAMAEVDQEELYGENLEPEHDLDFDGEINNSPSASRSASATATAPIARNLYFADDKNIDDALKPFQQPQIPRKVLPGEPILLPLSNLGAADPTAPAESGVAVSLPPNIFNALVRRDILHTCAVWFRASMRRGTHRTLGRSEVAFSKKKIRPQKKTGKARLGHRGSPMLKKGGHAHPIRPRDYSYHLPRKIRALGMRMALSSKLYMNNLRVVESLNEAGWNATYQAARALSSGMRIVGDYGYPADEARETKRAKQAEKMLPPYKRAALIRQKNAAVDEALEAEERAAREEEEALRAREEEEAAAAEAAERVEQQGEGEGEKVAATAETTQTQAATTETATETATEAATQEAANDLLEETETESEAEPAEAPMYLEDVTIHSKGFGPRDDLSILFLYPPTKPAREIWDFARVLRNIPGVEIMSTDDVEVYHILKFKWLVLEGGAIDSIASHAGQIAPQLPDLGASIENTSTDVALTQDPAGKHDDPDATRIPPAWVLDKWRKVRGTKSLIRTFGLRNANIQKLLAKRAWNKIRKEGKEATADGVAAEIAKRKVGGVKALGRLQPKIGGSAGF